MSVTSVAILCRSWVRSVLLPVLVVAFCGACTVGPLGPQSESFATPDHTVKPAGPPLPLPSPTEPPATPVPPTVALPTMTAMPPTATASVPSPTARPATATVPPAPSPPPPTPTVPPPPPTQPPPPTRPAPTATVPLPTATPEPAPTLVRPVRPAPGRYGLAAVASGFRRPLYLTAAPGDTAGRLFVVEQDGTIITVRDGRRQEPPFLDIRDRVHARANEQGLLSMAFDPGFAANGTFYVYYTDSRGATVVARYRLAPNNPAVADPGSEEIVLRVDQPFSNHNGGLVLFGPDGYLYVGLGDGGSGGDPQGHGQDPRTLLGTILRVDVRRSSTYVVPPDNPFVGQSDRRSEIWAYGLRNPWRFSFDRLTGDLYIADVGQNAWEEVSFQRASSKGGENYGWKVYEGSALFQGPPRAGLTPPISEYGRQEGCSVTGGYVYRGRQLPALVGNYLFGDFCTGFVWALTPQADGAWVRTLLFDSSAQITSFGEDANGEVYVVDRRGTIYRVTAAG